MTNPYDPPRSPAPIVDQRTSTKFEKQRHGCLTAWLILMIVANSLAAIVTPMSVQNIQQTMPNFPTWLVWPIVLMAILNIVFAVALFNWKKWGFFGFAATTIISFSLNIYAGVGIAQSIVGLSGIAILFLVLQIGGERKGWVQLD